MSGNGRRPVTVYRIPVNRKGVPVTVHPWLITTLISREDARNGSEPGRPSPEAIWNGGLGYCLLGTSEQ